jgi:UDP-galactopyranose mutase
MEMTTPTRHLTTDLVCFSHLRWDFVVQRPQHLMRRFGRVRRVFFVEEPVQETGCRPHLAISEREDGVRVVVPVLPSLHDAARVDRLQKQLITAMLDEQGIRTPTFWYYTPLALAFTPSLRADCVIYDCMDELSAFKNAPPELLAYERELLARADHVFTGGHSLYESKTGRHPSVHEFPSSIDAGHFTRARGPLAEPHDLRGLAHPRIGFYGVIDERLDVELLREVAAARPGYEFVLVGPVLKIDEASIPRMPNLHLLGRKEYDDLPAYLAHWDVAMMPFAMNDATRFISPTKTPEFLAAGLPVVSTPVRDVVDPYGRAGLVHIASRAGEFAECIDAVLAEEETHSIEAVDRFLASNSWDSTWERMARIEALTASRRTASAGALAR